MNTIFTAVSFAKVPLLEVGPLAQQILERGWEWSRNDSDWVSLFRKDFPRTVTTDEAEQEIVEIMGEYYLTVDEREQRAKAWAAKLKA